MVVVHAFKPSTEEAEGRQTSVVSLGPAWLIEQIPGLYRETLSQNTITKKTNKQTKSKINKPKNPNKRAWE